MSKSVFDLDQASGVSRSIGGADVIPIELLYEARKYLRHHSFKQIAKKKRAQPTGPKMSFKDALYHVVWRACKADPVEGNKIFNQVCRTGDFTPVLVYLDLTDEPLHVG